MITARFASRFWTSIEALTAGQEAIGVFVHLVFYACEFGMLDGRMDALPISRRDRPNRRALAALVRGGLIREEGRTIVLLGRDDLWSFFNPKPISPAERRQLMGEVAARDGAACAYCGTTERLTLDHVIPRSRGDSNKAKNLVIACGRCNTSKSDRTPQEWRNGSAGEALS